MPSVKLIPNSYTNTGSYNFTVNTSNNTYKISNAYTDADSSTYARLTLASNRNNSRTSTMYMEFDKSAISNLPSSANITSISANVRYAINNTTYVSAISIQLHANTTAKGNAVTTRSTTSATSGGAKYTITPGSWTLSELQNIRLYISATHNASTSSGYVYFYGADVTVNYSITEYTVNASSTASGITIQPASQTVYQGESATVILNDNTNIIVTDNNVDVTSQLVQKTETGASYSVVTASGASYGFSLNSNNYYESGNKGVDKSAAVCVVSIHVPVAATVTFSFINYAEATYDFGVFGTLDGTLSNNYYAAGSGGATISDSTYELACNTSARNTSSVQTLNYTVPSGDHNIYVKFSKDDASAANNDTLQFKVAITLNEPFTPGIYYEYTIANVQTNHTILVASSGGQTLPIRVKSNGSWVTAQKVFVKQNGTWQQATKVLVKDNGIWK